MIRYALAMVAGDGLRLLGLVSGLAFAALLISQQAAVYLGLVDRTAGYQQDVARTDLWVVDPRARFIQDEMPLPERELERVRSVSGVASAAPVALARVMVRVPGCRDQLCELIGVDLADAPALPRQFVSGRWADLRRPDAVFVEAAAAAEALVEGPGGRGAALAINDEVVIGGRRAVIAGMVHCAPSFYWEPRIYTTRERLAAFVGRQSRPLTAIQVQVTLGQSPAAVAGRIAQRTGLAAYTGSEFRRLSAAYVLAATPLLENFGLAVLVAVVVGAVIAGQTFHAYVQQNLRQLAAFKAMGANDGRLVAMLLAQALFVGGIGYGIGVGGAALLGRAGAPDLAFRLDSRLLGLTAMMIVLVCGVAALVAARRVIALPPATVFRG
jgi:putative ABC transport system permease protein